MAVTSTGIFYLRAGTGAALTEAWYGLPAGTRCRIVEHHDDGTSLVQIDGEDAWVPTHLLGIPRVHIEPGWH